MTNSQIAFNLQGLRRRSGMSLAFNCLIMERQFFEDVRAIVDRVRRFLAADCISPGRREFLRTSTAIASGLAMTSIIGLYPAAAAPLKEVRFSEAVHNLGYINLYVGMHAGIFEKNGLKMNVTAAGGDTQTFAAVLGGSADFAIGDATMVQMSREAGGPGVVVGTVVQRAHYFGVSKNLEPITDPEAVQGPDDRHLARAQHQLQRRQAHARERRPQDRRGRRRSCRSIPAPRSAPCWPARRTWRSPTSPASPAAEARAPRWCSTSRTMSARSATPASWSCPTTIERDPEMVQALVTSFEEASRLTYGDPAFAKKVARQEFPDLPGEVVDTAIDAELQYLIPAQSVVTQADQWKNLMDMQSLPRQREGLDPDRRDHRQLLRREGGQAAERLSSGCCSRPRCAARALAGGGRPSRRWSSTGCARSTTMAGARCRSSPTSPSRSKRARSSASSGPSGCGKTTLLNVLCGLIAADAGRDQLVRPRRAPACRRASATCCRRICCFRGAPRSAT